MKKIVFSIALLGGISANAQQLLEVLKPRGSFVDNFVPSEKCLELVYDRKYGDGEHDFIYCAVQGPNGKKWLNLNLGAEYAKESSEYFNPQATPETYYDWKAFGSLFQYGRRADGHELVEYFPKDPLTASNKVWIVRRINGITEEKQDMLTSGKQFVRQIENHNALSLPWYIEKDSSEDYRYMMEMWVHPDRNPCPKNYRMIDKQDIKDYFGNSWTPSDASLLGDFASASVLTSTTYPNLNIVTAPTTGVYAEVYKENGIQIDNRQRTTAAVKGTDKDGTSSLWVWEESNYSTPEFFRQSHLPRVVWERGTGINVYQINMFDRGLFDSGEKLPYGFHNHNSANGSAAVRCMECPNCE